MQLYCHIGSTCQHSKSNRNALKYFTFTTTLANAIVSAIVVQKCCGCLTLDYLYTMQVLLHSSELHFRMLT